MILMQNKKNWSSSIGLLFKLRKLYCISRNYEELWFPNCFKRCSYCSMIERKKENSFTLRKFAYQNIFKKQKCPQVCISQEVIDMLCDIFDVNQDEEFSKALLRNEHLGKCSEKHLRNTALHLRELNIKEDHIIFAPGILLYKKDDIEAKRLLIEYSYLFKNIRDGLGFVSFLPATIERYNKQFEEEYDKFSPFRNRIYYIGGKLNLPIDFLSLKIVKEWKILSLEKERLDLFIDLLSELKCRPMAIINDLNIFFRNYDIVKKRLKEMSQIKGSPPHNLRWAYTTDEIYERYYEKAKKYENCYVDNVLELLQEELQLSKEEAQDFISRGRLERFCPKILRYKITKYKEEGFTRDAFIQNPNVLVRSVEKMLKRIKILKEKGVFEYAKFHMIAYKDNYFEERVKFLEGVKKHCERSAS